MITILLIDDEESLLHVCKTYLERSNDLRVDTVLSVKDAETKMGETAYDAIVCDYQMPWRTGTEFLKRLRLNKNQIPFILFTGKSSEDVAIDALNSGADYFLLKGGDPKAKFSDLEHMVRDAVHERRWQDMLTLKNRAFDQCGGANLIVTPDFHIQEANQAFLDLVALTERDKVIDSPLQQYLQNPELVDVVITSMGTLGRWEGDFTAKKGDDTTMPVYGQVASMLDETGKNNGYLITITDHSKQRCNEENLKGKEQLYRQMVEASGDWTMMLDAKGDIVYCSPGVMRYSNHRPEGLQGFDLERFIHPDDVQEVARHLRELVEKDDTPPFQFRLRDRNDHYFLLETKASLVRDGESRLLNVIMSNRNIDQRVPFVPPPAVEVEVPAVPEPLVIPELVEEELPPEVIPETVPIEASVEVQPEEIPPVAETSPMMETAPPVKEVTISRSGDLEKLEQLQRQLEAEKALASDDVAKGRLTEMEALVSSIIGHAQMSKEFADIGKSEPEWHSMDQVIDNIVSGMDLGFVHVQSLVKRLEVRADQGLSKAFRNLLQYSLDNDPKTYKVMVHYEVEPEGARIVYEDNGSGTSAENKASLFDAERDETHGLAFAKQVLQATNISMEETGSPGRGLRFEMLVPNDQYRLK